MFEAMWWKLPTLLKNINPEISMIDIAFFFHFNKIYKCKNMLCLKILYVIYDSNVCTKHGFTIFVLSNNTK